MYVLLRHNIGYLAVEVSFIIDCVVTFWYPVSVKIDLFSFLLFLVEVAVVAAAR